MPEVGDLVTATLTVSPHDATTAAALRVEQPDGTTLLPVVSPGEGGVFTAPVEYTLAGVWLLHWTVTGTGASVETEEIGVAPASTTVPDGRAYATTTQLATYLRDAPPPGAVRLLADASRMLDARVLAYCRYDVTPAGLPADPVVAEAIGRAVCAQVAWWGEVGDSTGAAGVGWGSVAIGSVNLGRSVTSVSGDDSAARQLAPQVADELRAPQLAGRFWLGAVSTW
ncbi:MULTISPECIES: hypothetical protein [Streptomyces]|uniref:Uncharacterized protein n=1 Tax=Streptomyces evansiae TaxID=3075535 RepID=A0ABU2R132_9ACTN|nr:MULTISPECIES: hypothetical protein [unclassified Streptomyces]MDT0409951.1 hypothetical protein [Streptomyces sp. DSM 41979]MYQ59962.1 hypothetical protein [Streptomyces sp. SID4926]SCE54147.1 hypothetical protein GA0115252_16052 [Streptomyces sp. DfronAA-171]